MNRKLIITGGIMYSSFFFAACSNVDEHAHQHENQDSVHHHADTSAHHDHHHGHANSYMNESEFQELVDRFENPEREEWQMPAEVIRFMGELKGKTIVDIGAGTGYFAFRLPNDAKQIIAADPDQRFVDFITEKNEKENKKNLLVRKAEYEHPPVENEEADLVFMVNVYHHIENRIDYFTELKKGLKKGGELLIVDFKKGELPVGPPAEMKISLEDMMHELKSAGFKEIKRDTTTLPYQFMLKVK